MNVVSVKKLQRDTVFEKDVLTEERVFDPATGKKTTVLRTIKLDSADFGIAFTKVFQSNVTKARRDTKRRLSMAHGKPSADS